MNEDKIDLSALALDPARAEKLAALAIDRAWGVLRWSRIAIVGGALALAAGVLLLLRPVDSPRTDALLLGQMPTADDVMAVGR